MSYKISTKQITETVAPVIEPISLPEAKAHLREDYNDSDMYRDEQNAARYSLHEIRDTEVFDENCGFGYGRWME